MNIVPVVLGMVIIYGIGSAVFVFGAPFPNARALIPSNESVSNSVESRLGPENQSLEVEFVYFTVLQQVIFNAGRAFIEIRDPAPSQQVSSSSRNLTSILAKYVLGGWRRRFRQSLLSSSMGTVLRMFRY